MVTYHTLKFVQNDKITGDHENEMIGCGVPLLWQFAQPRTPEQGYLMIWFLSNCNGISKWFKYEYL